MEAGARPCSLSRCALRNAGITNHDEYSLVRENQEEEAENKPNFGTLTLRRKKDEKERDQKMEQLKKKIKTDDEREWRWPAFKGPPSSFFPFSLSLCVALRRSASLCVSAGVPFHRPLGCFGAIFHLGAQFRGAFMCGAPLCSRAT